MAWAIEGGRLRPEIPNNFSDKFGVFKKEELSGGLNTNGMVALIGLKSTGKTSMLKYMLHECPNPFFLVIRSDDVHGTIHHALTKSIWSLPWPLNGVRLDAGKSHEETVVEVFNRVKKWSHRPVLLGLDIVEESVRGDPVNHARSTMVPELLHGVLGNLPQLPQRVDAKLLVKRVKYLVADEMCAKAIIATSEGLPFMAVNEPRLRKIPGREMELGRAKAYLRSIQQDMQLTDDMLTQLPRTFASLLGFADASDKTAFCRKQMTIIMQSIKESAMHCEDAKSFYEKAVQPDGVGIDDICKHCGNKARFLEHFVVTNLFVQRDDTMYVLQFDCIERAAKEVLGF